MEKDAQERAENRRKNKILADELKAKGNDAFHQQMYEQAVDYYTQVQIGLVSRSQSTMSTLGFATEEGLRYLVYEPGTGVCETGTLCRRRDRLRLGAESKQASNRS